jgi:hypothetical protein
MLSPFQVQVALPLDRYLPIHLVAKTSTATINVIIVVVDLPLIVRGPPMPELLIPQDVQLSLNEIVVPQLLMVDVRQPQKLVVGRKSTVVLVHQPFLQPSIPTMVILTLTRTMPIQRKQKRMSVFQWTMMMTMNNVINVELILKKWRNSQGK